MMHFKKNICFMALCGILLLTPYLHAQQKPEPAMQETVTISGTVEYWQRSERYGIDTGGPDGRLMIVNENAGLLADLAKSRKRTTFTGHFDGGADQFYIEKVNGKKYSNGDNQKLRDQLPVHKKK